MCAGASDEPAPAEFDAALIFAPVGALVPAALRATRKGGRVICAGIHMSDIPSFPYADLWGERTIASVANLTRDDWTTFFKVAPTTRVTTAPTALPIVAAHIALMIGRSSCRERVGQYVETTVAADPSKQ